MGGSRNLTVGHDWDLGRSFQRSPGRLYTALPVVREAKIPKAKYFFAYLTVNFACDVAHKSSNMRKSPSACYTYRDADCGCILSSWYPARVINLKLRLSYRQIREVTLLGLTNRDIRYAMSLVLVDCTPLQKQAKH